MAREKNQLTTVQITISTNTVLRDALDKIVLTGYYGNVRAEAAERLLAEAVRSLIKEGTIVRKQRIVRM
jgi:hypothetical protein